MLQSNAQRLETVGRLILYYGWEKTQYVDHERQLNNE